MISTEPTPTAPGTLMPTKIQPGHRDRWAVVYVRQSSPQQVLEHRESAALQYALRQRAIEWAWPSDRVLVIDEDQGCSGTTAEGRLGFQRLLAEVSLDRVGLVLGIEMSRLARSCKDWHQLLELCAVFGTLLADQDGLYDPRDYNDRLLLGLRRFWPDTHGPVSVRTPWRLIPWLRTSGGSPTWLDTCIYPCPRFTSGCVAPGYMLGSCRWLGDDGSSGLMPTNWIACGAYTTAREAGITNLRLQS